MYVCIYVHCTVCTVELCAFLAAHLNIQMKYICALYSYNISCMRLRNINIIVQCTINEKPVFCKVGIYLIVQYKIERDYLRLYNIGRGGGE